MYWVGGLSLVVSLVITVGSQLNTARHFEKTQHRMRKGEKVHGRSPTELGQEFHITYGTMFLGLMFGSALVGYVIFVTVSFGLLSGITMLVRIAVGYEEIPESFRTGAWKLFVSVLVPIFLFVLVKNMVIDGLIGKNCLTVKNSCVNWTVWVWFTSICLFIDLAKGIAAAIARSMILILLCALHILQIHQSVFPEFMHSFDKGYRAFMSLAVFYHRHQNPVWDAFIHHMRYKKEDQTKLTDSYRRAQRRWHLAWTLLHNPQLHAERRNYAERAKVDRKHTMPTDGQEA